MKIIIVYFSNALLILFCTTLLFAADNIVVETKDAIVHDAKAIKEQVPEDMKEVKKEFINKSNKVKASTKQEAKEIKEGFKNMKPSTSEKK